MFIALTLGGLIYLPKKLKLWDPPADIDEENHLLKHASAMKRRRNTRNKHNQQWVNIGYVVFSSVRRVVGIAAIL